MDHDAFQSLVDELDTLLEQERAALLSGDFEQIKRLLVRKDALISGLNKLAPMAQPRLDGLQVKVARNQTLLDGALQGIRRVSTRIAAFRTVRKTLETYDETGAKHAIGGDPARSLEKRA